MLIDLEARTEEQSQYAAGAGHDDANEGALAQACDLFVFACIVCVIVVITIAIGRSRRRGRCRACGDRPGSCFFHGV